MMTGLFGPSAEGLPIQTNQDAPLTKGVKETSLT